MLTSHGSPSAAYLRSLAENMRTKLPRELRDMIDSYVWDKDTVNSLELPRTLGSHRLNRLPTHTPVAANRHIVGEQVAAEAVEWLYSNSHDITIGEPNQLPIFLAGDLYGVGVKAKNYPIRKITTVVSITGGTILTTARQFCTYFAPLTTSKLHCDFILHVRVCSNDIRHLEAQALFQVACQLRSAMDSLQGRTVAVRLTYEHIRVPEWDVTRLMGIPPVKLFLAMCAKLNEVSFDTHVFWEVKLTWTIVLSGQLGERQFLPAPCN
jgi:hypothetical protein